MKVKDLIKVLEGIDPELDVYVIGGNGYIEESYSAYDTKLVLGSHIEDGGHIFDDQELEDYKTELEEDGSWDEDDYDFIGDAFIITV